VSPDRPDYALLARYLGGECTEAESAQVAVWLAADPENHGELEAFERLWRASAAHPTRVDADAAWSRVEQAMNQEPAPRIERRPAFVVSRSARWWTPLKVAAALVAMVGAGLGGRAVWQSAVRSREAPASTFNVISTARGQRLGIRLSDGTQVTLAPSTTLRTPSTYGARERTVQLDGEAVFTVVHDSTRPFAVRTARAVARDIGTRFVVRAYADDPATDVVVAEGEVAVGKVVIRRGDRARVERDGRLALTRDVPLDHYFAWTEGRLVFHDTPLSEVVVQLRRWYDADVHLASSAAASLPVTATFDNQSVDEAVGRLALALGLELSRSGRSFTLRSR
jgi:transmembrane sensor